MRPSNDLRQQIHRDTDRSMQSSLEVNLELVPSQVGSAILNLGTGEVLKTTGELATENAVTFTTLHKIVKDSLRCLSTENLKRISVVFNESSYVITTADNFIYIVRVTNK